MSLALRTAVAVVPAGRRPGHYEPDVIDFNQSVLGPYGLRFQAEWADKGGNVTFLALAEQLLAASPDVSAPGLLIVAYALPDPHALERTLSAHLNHVLGGRSMSFAVSEQGLAAPFTALRIAAAYAGSGRCDSVALFILEQATFPYPVPFVQDTGLVDSGVLLAFGPSGEWELTTQIPSEGPDTLPAGPDTLVVAGPWFDPGLAGPKVHRVPPGSYGTSVWLELARHHQEWAADYATLVVCDTDPETGVSQSVTLSRRGAGGGRGH